MSKSGYSRVCRLRRVCGLFVASIGLAACQHLGPWALEEGRQRYNEKIHLTSRDQLFANIVRVANNETPFFMDVSEVDAAELIQGAVSGGATGIGGLSGLSNGGQLVTFPNGTGAVRSEKVTSHGGAFAGSFQYQESPTIRYFPLAGQALVAQIVTPISVTSIANLYSSDWQFLPLLDFSLDRLTPNDQDYYAALNAIVALDDYRALVVAATKSDATTPETPKPQRIDGTNITVQSAPPTAQAIDSLTLYLQPDKPNVRGLGVDPEQPLVEETVCSNGKPVTTKVYELPVNDDQKLLLAKRNIMHLWIRLLRIYAGTQVEDSPPNSQKAQPSTASRKTVQKTSTSRITDLQALDHNVGHLDSKQLDEDFEKLPKKIELRSSAVPKRREQPTPPKPPSGSGPENISPKNKAPIIQTHSALGILLYAVHDYPIEFLTPDAYKAILAHPWNRPTPSRGDFYTVLTSDENSLCKIWPSFCYSWADTKEQECVSSWVENNPTNHHVTFSIQGDVSEYKVVKAEDALGSLRRLLLIIVTDSAAPPDAFVFYTAYGKTFYIDGADVISRKNFALVSQFMTMQAVPPTTAPLTPTISVGAGG